MALNVAAPGGFGANLIKKRKKKRMQKEAFSK